MKAATEPVQRPSEARLLAIDPAGQLRHLPRSRLAELLRAGDLLVANDAATLPASLRGVHEASGEEIELRLAGRTSLAFEDIREVTALALGRGDHRVATEERPLPPALAPGDRLRLGPLRAVVVRTLGHPRLLDLAFEGTAGEIWAGIARHGRPIQYSYLRHDLELWDVWTRVAALPAAFEAPSAGFLLDWRLLDELRRRGVAFASLTHAAGISSTGDPALDRTLPLDEPYRIPAATVRAIERARAAGGRVIALGTTVARALEHAAVRCGLCSGDGLADQKISPSTRLRVVDAIVSGTHEPGESHYELLGAFADELLLRRMSSALQRGGYRSHEFGDSVFLERQRSRVPAPGGADSDIIAP